MAKYRCVRCNNPVGTPLATCNECLEADSTARLKQFSDITASVEKVRAMSVKLGQQVARQALLDQFAGQAMHAILNTSDDERRKFNGANYFPAVAMEAYEAADAMMAEHDKRAAAYIDAVLP